MRYAKVTQEQALMRPQLMRVLLANQMDLNAQHYLVPENSPDISFVLLNLEPWGEVEWVTLKGRQEPGIKSVI